MSYFKEEVYNDQIKDQLIDNYRSIVGGIGEDARTPTAASTKLLNHLLETR